jgi:hypothetical protein
MKNIFIILLLCFVSTSAYSKYVTPLSGPGVEITKFFTHTNGAVSLYISGAVQNLDQCTSTFRVYIPHDLPGKDTLVSAAMMAFASGRKVGFHGSGCGTTGFWGGTVDVPIINNLWIF